MAARSSRVPPRVLNACQIRRSFAGSTHVHHRCFIDPEPLRNGAKDRLAQCGRIRGVEKFDARRFGAIGVRRLLRVYSHRTRFVRPNSPGRWGVIVAARWACVLNRSCLAEHGLVSFVHFVISESRRAVSLRADFEVRRFTGEVLGMQFLQERDAPAAARSGGETFADERGNRRILSGKIAADLPERDMKAEADMIIGVHAQG